MSYIQINIFYFPTNVIEIFGGKVNLVYSLFYYSIFSRILSILENYKIPLFIINAVVRTK